MKRILCALLAALLVIASLASAVAAGEFRLSANPTDSFAITADGETLVLSGLPVSPEFEYLFLDLLDEDGGKHNKVWTVRSSDGTAVYDISEVDDGMYYLELYTRKDGDDVYWSYFYGEMIMLRITGGCADFVTSPVYDANEAVRARARVDSAAQTFYLAPASQIQSDAAAIKTLAASLTKDSADNYAKALAIHDWVTSNIRYDYGVLYGTVPRGDMSSAATLERRTAVCDGFSNLTAALLRAAGIPAKFVSGYGIVPGEGGWNDSNLTATANHSWIEAFIDGRWVIIDATWDAAHDEYAGSRMYFDPSGELFAASHRLDAYSESNLPPLTARRMTSTVLIDGEAVAFEAYTIDGNNYFKLRDLALALDGSAAGFEVEWDPVTRDITLVRGESYTPNGAEMSRSDGTVPSPVPSSSRVYLDGERARLTVYSIGGSNYFKLRDLGASLGFDITWDSAAGIILIDTSSPYTPD